MSPSPPARPDRNALLELDALLARIIDLREDGDRARYDSDDQYRWAIHRLWIAVGNEALAYTDGAGLNPNKDQPWARMYQQRNLLAHRRLPEIDEDRVWRNTVLRPEPYRAAVRESLS